MAISPGAEAIGGTW